MIKVAIVEDDEKLRETLERFIQAQSGFRCVGAFANGESALTGIPGANPDVVLMDINLPGISGIECVKQLRSEISAARIIMLTVFDEGEQIFNALTVGAFGYLLKSTPPNEILEAIRDVHAGGSPMSSSIARKVVQIMQSQTVKQSTRCPETETLSAREIEVLQALSKGYPYKQIAADLNIHIGTVRTYIRRIYEKLQVHSHGEAVMKFAQK